MWIFIYVTGVACKILLCFQSKHIFQTLFHTNELDNEELFQFLNHYKYYIKPE